MTHGPATMMKSSAQNQRDSSDGINSSRKTSQLGKVHHFAGHERVLCVRHRVFGNTLRTTTAIEEFSIAQPASDVETLLRSDNFPVNRHDSLTLFGNRRNSGDCCSESREQFWFVNQSLQRLSQ